MIEHNKSLSTFIKTLEGINHKFSSDGSHIYTIVEDSMRSYIYGARYETDEEYKERIHGVLKELDFKDKVILHKLILNNIGNL